METPLRVDVLPADPPPDPGHPLDPLAGRVGGEAHAVDGADRGAVDPVRDEAVLGQHLEHPDLDGSPGAPPGEHQGGHALVVVVLVPVGRGALGVVGGPGVGGSLVGQPLGPGATGLSDQEPEGQHDEHQRGEHEEAEHDGEGGARGRSLHRARGYRGVPVGQGRVTPGDHTVAMEMTDAPTGEHTEVATGAHGAGSGPGRRQATPWTPPAGDALRDSGRPRPRVDEAFVEALRVDLDRGLDDVVGTSGTSLTGPGVAGRTVVTKDRLTRALTCASHRPSDAPGTVPFTVPLACGALVDALFRQLVTTGRIDDPMSEGLEALALDDLQAPLVGWIASLPAAERGGLRAEVERQSDGLRARWPALDPAWLPRTQVPLRADLAGGRVECRARVDLAVGRPAETESTVALVEVKSGARRAVHRADLGFYALLETLRTGAPPFAVATYYTRTGELDVEPVTGASVVESARRLLAGVAALVDGGRAAPSTVDPRWCATCAAGPLLGPGFAVRRPDVVVLPRDGGAPSAPTPDRAASPFVTGRAA